MHHHNLRFFSILEFRHEAAYTPYTAFDAIACKLIEEVLRVLREVFVDYLCHFAMGGVFAIKLFAGKAVDVFNVVVFDALFEDFSADEAGDAGEEDLHDCFLCSGDVREDGRVFAAWRVTWEVG